MRDSIQTAVSSRELILAEAEAARRMSLLAELQGALAGQGIRCVLARNRRLVLRYSGDPCEPSGPTSPHLHVFGPDSTDVASTDGATFSLASGPRYPAADPAAAAIAIAQGQQAAQPALPRQPRREPPARDPSRRP